MTTFGIERGRPGPMGVTHDGDGANVAVFSEHAESIELCLFSQDGTEEVARLPLPERTGSIWHGHVPGLPVGTLYGLRAHGPFAPSEGHRFNPNKLLLDPYARQYHGSFTNAPETYGFDRTSPEADLSFSESDSAPFMPKCVIPDATLFQPALSPLAHAPLSELIYEAHAKGLTMAHPGVPEAQRGTYDGLASDAMIEHLHRLGVSSIELLPVHAFLDDGFLVAKGLRNYWGYNTIGFFTPEPRYFGPDGITGFRRMVQRFHDADIRVILDVVYNHTAEGDHLGPTLSFRGLDNASYYRLAENRQFYINDTGTGNTLDLTNPHVLRMVTDSLRFWVTQMGIDGFRFDLATTLCREAHGYDRHCGFLDALRQDPVLSRVRLIAEPWDIGPGGYQLGNFPSEFSEWNDTFRDTARRFWRGDVGSTQELGARLLGSADHFDRTGRRTWASVNFLTSHDGFTLADTCAYSRKHNEANLEDNRDGHDGNYSDNFGTEGPSTDAQVNAARARRARNMLATMMLSQGTPMLLAGDEVGNSQSGNNNAYCQDNEIGWIDWSGGLDPDLPAFVARLSAFRRDHCTVRQSHFLHGKARAEDGLPDVVWTDFKGKDPNWGDTRLSRLCLIKRPSAEATITEDDTDMVALAFNRSDRRAVLTLPAPPEGHLWVRAIDTSDPTAPAATIADPTRIRIEAASVIAFELAPEGTST